MSDANGVTAFDTVRRLTAEAAMRMRGSPHEAGVTAISDRLAGPLTLAIAGRVKAGKSTLLNALVGERLAPTDAGECTRVVCWYHEGIGYEVQALLRDGAVAPVPFTRHDGALVMDVGRFDLATVDRLDVSWPSSALRTLTLVDTPGLASLNDENSLRTREFLAMGESRPSDADAVVYLMRHLHRKDAEFLGAFCDRGVVASSPVNAVAVLSRADEIGAGRLDALDSAIRIAARYTADDDVRGLCASVIPVAGLLAETGQTWREQEASAVRALAVTPRAELELMLVSADEFVEPSASELTVELRRDLLARLGMFGLRFLVTEVFAGRVNTAGEMSRALVARSGLDALRSFISEHFLPRTQVLKARSALAGLRALARPLSAADPTTASWLLAEVERLEAASHEFGLLRLGHLVATGMVRLSSDERADVDRIVAGGSLAQRLGASDGEPPEALRSRALEGLERWRLRGSDPMADGPTVEVADTMARGYEAVYLAACEPAAPASPWAPPTV
ncbi:MAG TPA: dynamin family protein [Acidimicrobiales bacterium]